MADPGAQPGQEQPLKELERRIALLDPLHRALVGLYLDDLSYAQIAEVLGITETNVATKLNRIKERWRKENRDGTR